MVLGGLYFILVVVFVWCSRSIHRVDSEVNAGLLICFISVVHLLWGGVGWGEERRPCER